MALVLDVPSVYLTIAPDWADGIRFSHIWRTGMLIAKSGVEQRSSYFSWARKRMNFYLALLEYKETAWMKRMLFKYMKEIWGIPIWPDVAILREVALAGDVLIPVVSTASRHFAAGDECVLIDANDFTVFEVRTIETVAADLITVTQILQNEWPEGAYVYPVFNAMMATEELIDLRTAEVSGVSLTMTESYTGTSDGGSGGSTVTTTGPPV